MKLAIYNHLDGSHQEIEGDTYTLERTLYAMFPWLLKHFAFGSLEDIIDYIDNMQHRSVEIVDESQHPLLKV